MAEKQIELLTKAAEKYNNDLAYFSRELAQVDAQIAKVNEDAQKSATKLNAANSEQEKQLRQDNKGFQSQRQGMYESMRGNLLTGKMRSEKSLQEVQAALQRLKGGVQQSTATTNAG